MPKYRIMPKGLQIKILKDLFLKFNKYLEEDGFDLMAKLDEIDWESLVNSSLSFPENLSNFERTYVQYQWKKPLEPDFIDESPSRKPLVMTVTPHRIKRKGKIYEYGAVLLHFTPELIGRKILINFTVIEES